MTHITHSIRIQASGFFYTWIRNGIFYPNVTSIAISLCLSHTPKNIRTHIFSRERIASFTIKCMLICMWLYNILFHFNCCIINLNCVVCYVCMPFNVHDLCVPNVEFVLQESNNKNTIEMYLMTHRPIDPLYSLPI